MLHSGPWYLDTHFALHLLQFENFSQPYCNFNKVFINCAALVISEIKGIVRHFGKYAYSHFCQWLETKRLIPLSIDKKKCISKHVELFFKHVTLERFSKSSNCAHDYHKSKMH